MNKKSIIIGSIVVVIIVIGISIIGIARAATVRVGAVLVNTPSLVAVESTRSAVLVRGVGGFTAGHANGTVRNVVDRVNVEGDLDVANAVVVQRGVLEAPGNVA